MRISLTIFFWTITKTISETFTIGYLTGSQRRPGDLEYSRPGLTISGAISLAVEEINQGIFALKGHRLTFNVAETFGEEIISVQKTAELWTKNVSVYIGPQETCEHEGYMAAAFNLPMISYFCTHYATSDKSLFPTFARTRPPDTQISKSVSSVLTAFNWTHITLLYLNSPDFEFGNIATTILNSLAESGVTVVATQTWDTPYHQGYMDNPFYDIVDQTYQDTRIYVIVGHYFEHLGLMIALEEHRLFDSGEYFVVGVDIEQYDRENPTKYLRDFLRDEMNPVAKRAYRSYLGVVPSSPIGFDNFTALVNSYMERPPFNFPNPLNHFGGGKMIRAEAAYLYDAVHLYSRALLTLLDSGMDPLNGTAIIDSIKQTHYKSAMGYMVYMDENGDAEGNYTLIARKSLEHRPEEYGLFPVGGFTLRGSTSRLPVLQLAESIDWISGSIPIAVPFCGFRNEYCISHTMEISLGVTGSLLTLFFIIALIMYRNWKYEQELDSLLWKLDFKDIQIKEQNSERSTQTVHPFIRTSQVSLSSNPDVDYRYSTIFAQVGIYKGRMLAIKKVYKKSIDITREMKKELKMMKDIRHDNLNAFIGACTEPPNICIVMEYCTRGSLRDILENEDVKLDSMFIASLVADILRGMIYLHDSAIRFHGSLHTGNCLVDSRWVVKISDFGLREFRKGEDNPSLKEPETVLEKCRTLLYRAPELLRSMKMYITSDPPRGTQKGDVYSFGIILYELHTRHGPFGDVGLSSAEILHRVHHIDGLPFRPPLDSLEGSVGFVCDCLRECWNENPDNRPDFKTIRTKLRSLRKGMKPNIFDNMMAMMEKYANNLEVLVDERTDQLQEEKKKTEALLYEMLPKPVAEQLKRGNKVEAEGFECVTIYFSDIVGFTAMSAESTPLQVVNFLNDLYTCFDSIIENYDVYKVETIGDAYMVVSGLPIRSENSHAGEIASMSLHLLSEVKNFIIRHRPHEKLFLRIGIHSGGVCAGVVGLKMPRYCLFGDTVNTASRMESTGVPLKIHCSKQCKELLTRLGGYHLVERGVVALKGKGEQQTYWLVGEDPSMKALRTLERQKRRAEAAGRVGQIDSNGHCLVAKSSMRQKKGGIIKTPIGRCCSFESPKRLRFASDENLNVTLKTRPLEVVTDHSYQKSTVSLMGVTGDVCSETLKTSSTSCPCIENLANSTATLAQSHLSMFLKDDRADKFMYQSVPTLTRSNLHVPCALKLQVISAPSSPNKAENLAMVKHYYEYEEMILWADSTPLLRVTKVEETNVLNV